MMQLNGMSQMNVLSSNPVLPESMEGVSQKSQDLIADLGANPAPEFVQDLELAMVENVEAKQPALIAQESDPAMEPKNLKLLLEQLRGNEHPQLPDVAEGEEDLRSAQMLVAAMQMASHPQVRPETHVEQESFAPREWKKEAVTISKLPKELEATIRQAVRSNTAAEVAGPSPMKEATPSADLHKFAVEPDAMMNLAVDSTAEVEVLQPARKQTAPVRKHWSGAEFLEARRSLEQRPMDRLTAAAVQPTNAKTNAESASWAEAFVDRARSERNDSLTPAGAQRISMADFSPSNPSTVLNGGMGLPFPANGPALPAVGLEARVTQGGMAQDRLNSESILGITQQISTMASVKGNGEIRLRLTPEHLGEIRLHVRTQGDQVGLSIQAARPDAQKILEESLPSLRESLSQHRLTLAQVDVVAPSISASPVSNLANSSFDSQGYGMSQGDVGQQAQHQSWQDRRGSGEPREDYREARTAQVAAPARAAHVSSKRLNIVA